MKQDHILYAMLLSLWLCFLINKLKQQQKKWYLKIKYIPAQKKMLKPV